MKRSWRERPDGSDRSHLVSSRSSGWRSTRFHDDPAATIRERAACSLAQSGMLNEKQRWRAVPRLLDYAGDYSLDSQTRSWVFQALRDITGQTLPPDASAWRIWYTRPRQPFSAPARRDYWLRTAAEI